MKRRRRKMMDTLVLEQFFLICKAFKPLGI
jgi:hypothetical protein